MPSVRIGCCINPEYDLKPVPHLFCLKQLFQLDVRETMFNPEGIQPLRNAMLQIQNFIGPQL